MKVFMFSFHHIVARLKEILVTEFKSMALLLHLGKFSKVEGPSEPPYAHFCRLINYSRVREEDNSEVKSVSTAITIAENIVHDVEIPFDVNHFLYIGKFTCGYRNPQTDQGTCMYKFSPDSYFSDVCEIQQIQRTDMYKKKNLGSVFKSYQ